MQRKSANASKSGFTIGERRKSTSKILNRQRFAHKVNRLAGGADVFEEPTEEDPAEDLALVQEVLSPSLLSIPSIPSSSLTKEILEEPTQSKVTNKDNSPEEQHFPASSCSFQQTPGSIGEVDEIIEYVHQNLKEAGKALATLSESFQYDLKIEPHTQLERRKTVSISRGRKRRS